jgi:hypothetical protein
MEEKMKQTEFAGYNNRHPLPSKQRVKRVARWALAGAGMTLAASLAWAWPRVPGDTHFFGTQQS